MTQKQIDKIYSKVNDLVEEGVQFAEDSPFPEPSELLEDVYCVKGA